MPQPTKQDLIAQKQGVDDEIVAMLKTFDTAEFKALPEDEQKRQKDQWFHMGQYSAALYARIQAAEG